MAAFLAVVVAVLVAVVPLPHAFALANYIGANRMRQPTRILQRTGLEACNESREENLDTTYDTYKYNTSCSSCEVNSMGFTFECIDECSECSIYFNGSTTVCFRESFYSEQYDPAGNRTGSVAVYEFTGGEGYGAPSLGTKFREELVFVGGMKESCEFFVNDEKCTSCERRKCNETDSGDMIDCSNVLASSVYDECTETYTGVLEFLSFDYESYYVTCDSPPLTTTAATTAVDTAATTAAADSGTSPTASSPTTAAADSGTSPTAADDPSCAPTVVKTLQVLPFAAISIVASGFYV